MSNNTTGYNCVDPNDKVCAENCVSLAACEECNCSVYSTEPASGPWGDVMDVIFCLLPIVFLIVVTIKPHPMPTTRSLPLAALMMFLIRLAYLGSDPLLTCGAVILGLLEALTPLSIMAGAIMLFETMEVTLCLPYIMQEIKALTGGHSIAELLLLFSFAYTVEGASGFGTPVALSAPMLVQTGQPPLQSVVVMLLFNTFATVWGAVGTPLWFGFSEVENLTDDELLKVSRKAAIALAICGMILIPLICTILVSWRNLRSNLFFVYGALITCIGPSVGIAFINYEFPSLMGGLVGCLLTSTLIKFRIGLVPMKPDEEPKDDQAKGNDESSSSPSEERKESEQDDSVAIEIEEQGLESGFKPLQEDLEPEGKQRQHDAQGSESTRQEDAQDSKNTQRKEQDEHFDEEHQKSWKGGYLVELMMRTFPIWGVVLLLILTRVEQIGIKEYLKKTEPYFSIHFGTLGTFRLSVSLVFQMRDILTYPNLNWKYELLYVPFLIPFVLVSIVTMLIFRKDRTCSTRDIVSTVAGRLAKPAIALFGALVLVQLMIKAGTEAPAFILGTILAKWFKQGFVVISPLLGALGSFFSGSTTVSNLTFGEIQSIAATSIGTSRTSMLALQAVGASAGNGICLNNIIAACAVVGLTVGEGQILIKTYKFVLGITTIATVVMLAFFFRF